MAYITPTPSFAAGFAKGFANTLKEGIDKRTADYDLYLKNSMDTAKRKAPGMAKATNNLKNIMDIGDRLKAEYNITDAQFIALVQEGDIAEIANTIDTEAAQRTTAGLTLDKEQFVDKFMSAFSIPKNYLPDGPNAREAALKTILGMHTSNLISQGDPNSEIAQDNSWKKTLADFFVTNPRLSAEQAMEGMEVMGYKASELIGFTGVGQDYDENIRRTRQSLFDDISYDEGTALRTENYARSRVITQLTGIIGPDNSITLNAQLDSLGSTDEERRNKLIKIRSAAEGAAVAFSRFERQLINGGRDVGMSFIGQSGRTEILQGIMESIDDTDYGVTEVENFNSLVRANDGRAVQFLINAHEHHNGNIPEVVFDNLLAGNIDGDAWKGNSAVGQTIIPVDEDTLPKEEITSKTKPYDPERMIKINEETKKVVANEIKQDTSVTQEGEEANNNLINEVLELEEEVDKGEVGEGGVDEVTEVVSPNRVIMDDRLNPYNPDASLPKALLAGDAIRKALIVNDEAVASGLVNAADAVTATAADAGVLVSQFIGGLFDTDTGAAQAFFEDAANESRRNKMTPERMSEIGDAVSLKVKDMANTVSEFNMATNLKVEDMADIASDKFASILQDVHGFSTDVFEKISDIARSTYFTSEGVKTESGTIAYSDFAESNQYDSERMIEINKGAVASSDVDLSPKAYVEGDPEIPYARPKFSTIISDFINRTGGISTGEDLTPSISEVTGQPTTTLLEALSTGAEAYNSSAKAIETSVNTTLDNILDPDKTFKVDTSALKDFNARIKAFEKTLNLTVSGAIESAALATTSGVQSINAKLKDIEDAVNEGIQSQIDRRKPALMELRRQLSELTLMPSRTPGEIDTGPSVFSSENNKVRYTALKSFFELIGPDPEYYSQFPLDKRNTKENSGLEATLFDRMKERAKTDGGVSLLTPQAQEEIARKAAEVIRLEEEDAAATLREQILADPEGIISQMDQEELRAYISSGAIQTGEEMRIAKIALKKLYLP